VNQEISNQLTQIMIQKVNKKEDKDLKIQILQIKDRIVVVKDTYIMPGWNEIHYQSFKQDHPNLR